MFVRLTMVYMEFDPNIYIGTDDATDSMESLIRWVATDMTFASRDVKIEVDRHFCSCS